MIKRKKYLQFKHACKYTTNDRYLCHLLKTIMHAYLLRQSPRLLIFTYAEPSLNDSLKKAKLGSSRPSLPVCMYYVVM